MNGAAHFGSRGGDAGASDTRPVLKRLAYTRLRDLVRGRVDGRLDLSWIARSAGLPASCERVVLDVVSRTRLSRDEKIETCRELVAHFRDGLERGKSPEDLVSSFGDTREAAALIRRAAKRKRPLAWRVTVRALQAAACVAALGLLHIGWSTVRYWTATPVISRNFTAELNAPILAAAESDRAWPLYREAILMLGDIGAAPGFKDDQGRERVPTPGDPEWSAAMSYVDRARPALALFERGSERAHLGRPYQGAIEPELARAMAVFHEATVESFNTPAAMGSTTDNPPMIAVLLPEMTSLRRVSRLLCSYEAVDAAIGGDAARFERALVTTLGIARQLCDRGTVIEQMVGQAALALAVERLEWVCREHASLLDDAAMSRLSKRLMAVDPSLTFDAERLTMHDMAQRVFSDDGRGDGVLSREGMMALQRMLGENLGSPVPGGFSLESAVAPYSAGRRETLREWDRVFAMLDAASKSTDWSKAAAMVDQEVDAASRGPWREMRYPMLRVLLPALGHTIRSSQRAAMVRDGAVAGLALERYRRRAGAYPDSLDALVPTLLAHAPTDRCANAPVRYRLRNGAPLLYSVWQDSNDDGGTFEPQQPGNQPPDLKLWGW